MNSLGRSNRLALVGLCAVVCALTTGCLHSAQAERFRTPSGEGALQRAVASVASHCGGVQKVDPELGVIHGRWQDPKYNINFSKIFYRCIVTVLPNPSDESADVRISLQSVLCGPLDSLNPERSAEGCAPHPKVPTSALQHFERAVAGLREDVVRR
jgi:hypothetical protein